MWVQIIERLSKRACDVFVLIVQFLFVARGIGKSFPAQRVDEQGMFLQAFVEGILLRDDVDIFVVADDVEGVEFVVELFVTAEVVQGEVPCAATRGRIHGTSFPWT